MLQEERYERILTLLREKRHLTLQNVVDSLPVSSSTVRRDFRTLVERNLAKRSRGGISLPIGDSDHGNIPFELRSVTHAEEKERIALAAVPLLHPHDTIYMDGGTTTLQLARRLPNFPLTVITNSLPHITVMIDSHRDNSNLEIYTAGGYVYPAWNVNLGPQTRYCLSQYHAQCAFLSARGIDESGVYNHNELVVEVERTMIENADRVVFLMDHSKIGERSLSFVCELSKIDTFITSRHTKNQSLLNTIRAAGVHVVEVDT